jgi:cytochrome c biogenesis protein CcmG/thiol:disulfide interchange protein DsbE
MGNLKPMMLAPPLIFAALAVMFWVGMGREDPNQLPTALAGRAAPAVDLGPLDGKAGFADADLRAGEVVLVNYWASWCAPCRVEHPHLERLSDNGMTIYGVNYKDKPANALKFLKELGDPYEAIGTDPQGRMALDWGVYGVPETYVIDGDGVIVARHAGPITQRVLDTTLMPAIDKARARE